MTMSVAWRPDQLVLLIANAVLLGRAALVPSEPRRTTWISAASVAAIPADGYELGVGFHGEPRVLPELLLELAGRPSRITERHEHVARTVAAAHGLENVLRSGETHVVGDGERRLPIAERAMQHEAAVDLHRAAEVNGRGAQSVVGQRDVDLLEQRGQRHVDGLVHDDAQRAVLVVLAHVRERVGEMRIRHGRHGDQEVMGEVHLTFRSVQL